MRSIVEDLRVAARNLRNTPGFTAVAALTLGLGIAANTTVFGWINTVLLNSVPGVSNPHELAALEAIAPNGNRLVSCPHPDFRDFQRNMTSASGVVASHLAFFNVGAGDHPRRVLGQVVSANFFTVLGVRPFLGRMLLPQEDRDDRGAYPVAVISHRLWRSHFGANAKVVGRSARINGHTYSIVGVAPPEFRGTQGGIALDLWIPLSMVLETGSLNTWAAADRNARFLDVVIRLKPGTTIEQGRAEAGAVAAWIAAAYPDTHKGVSATLVPMWRTAYGLHSTLRGPLRILMFVCVLALLIACANVANLLLARCTGRRRELAVRMALGASRGRIVRQLMAESLLLGAAGSGVGILLAQWFGDGMHYALPALDSTVRGAAEPLLQTAPDRNVLAFAVLVSVAAAVLAAVMPALTARSVGVNETLKEGGRSGTQGIRSRRGRLALVVTEVALASMALIGAGLAVRSFQKLAGINPGFDPRNVMVAQFHLSTNGYSLANEKEFCRSLRLRLERAPGIESVTYGDSVPLSIFNPPSERIQADSSAGKDEGVLNVQRSVVAPGYFDLMHIPILAGRDFTERDDLEAPAVVIVNETFALRYFEGKDPIGRKIRVSGNWSTVVGLAKDAKYMRPGEEPTPFFYGPFRQIFFSGHNNFFYIRAANDGAARAILRREVAALDSGSGLYDASPLTDYMQAGLFGERVAAALLSALGVLSLLLAGLGLYSVMGYTVSERTQEIGIRMALGAQRRELLRMVLWKGLAMAAAGIAAGTAGVVAALRTLKSAVDLPLNADEPLVFAAAAVFLIAVAVAASYLPARRATTVDPLVVLRSQ